MVWQVDYGIVNGVRKRVTAKNEREADRLIKEWKTAKGEAGKWRVTLDPDEQLEARGILTAIKAKGFRLPQVWEEFQKAQQRAQIVTTPFRYKDAVDEWGKTKEKAGKSTKYVTSGKSTLLKFAEGRTEEWIHKFRSAELERWLGQQTEENGWELATKETYQSLFSSLWAVAKRKGWVTANIVDNLEKIVRPTKGIILYSNDEATAFMAAMMSTPNGSRALISPVLEGWGCMRPLEITGEKAIENGDTPFNWGDMDLEHGRATVRPEVAKKGDQRTIRLHIDAIDEGNGIGKLPVFTEILRDHGFRPDEVLVVGDNPDSEIAVGNRLGMVTIQILRPGGSSFTGRNPRIQTLSELKRFL